jgi:ADP-heptose:LPS heptosyltransferase
MKILFITSSRIGDAVLSSGLLSYIEQTYPQARATIACGPLATSLFEGFPLLERIIPLKKQSFNRHWIALWRETGLRRWDMVIDLRNSAISRLLLAQKRFILGSHIDQGTHKVCQNAAVMGLSPPPLPKLWFTAAQQTKAKLLIPDGSPVIGVGPTANWIGKTWPAERFITVIEYLLNRPEYKSARVAVFAAPGEEAAAYTVLKSIPAERALDIIAMGNPAEAAAALARCALYIGNDSGLMHCAAAANVPTFGLFGPSYPEIYGPWGSHTTYAVTPETFDQLINYPDYSPKTCGCLMTSLTVEAVIEKLDPFLKETNR